MAKFKITHQAPGGTKLYHYGVQSGLGDFDYGKVYGSETSTKEEDEKQLEICRKNFEYVYNNAGKDEWCAKESYRTGDHWNGHGLDKIETKIEYI